jgi:cytoskeleton protein RodZ
MSEPTQGQEAPADEGRTAGALLKAARESRGLHIAALAAAIKVSPRKLDALEGDRFDELPDATFARALAATVCRTLKVNHEEILSRMPAVEGRLSSLEERQEGLNAPFEARPARVDSGSRQTQGVLILAGLVLVLAAVALLMLPPGVWRSDGVPTPQQGDAQGIAAPAASTSEPAVPASAGATAFAPAPASSQAPAAETLAKAALTETVHSAPPAEASASRPGVGAESGAWIRVSEPSWVEAVDASGRALFSRVLQPGESVRLDPTQGLKVTIGNAASTQVEVRGQVLDLKPFTRENVARLELK